MLEKFHFDEKKRAHLSWHDSVKNVACSDICGLGLPICFALNSHVATSIRDVTFAPEMMS